MPLAEQLMSVVIEQFVREDMPGSLIERAARQTSQRDLGDGWHGIAHGDDFRHDAQGDLFRRLRVNINSNRGADAGDLFGRQPGFSQTFDARLMRLAAAEDADVRRGEGRAVSSALSSILGSCVRTAT